MEQFVLVFAPCWLVGCVALLFGSYAGLCFAEKQRTLGAFVSFLGGVGLAATVESQQRELVLWLLASAIACWSVGFYKTGLVLAKPLVKLPVALAKYRVRQ